jgi:hypothetical protein
VEQEELQRICVKLYRNHRAAFDAIIQYGNVNQLALRTAERTLQILRDQSAVPGRQIEWARNDGSGWIAIWPRHWPTGPRRGWPAYYSVLFETQGFTEKIKVGIQFDRLPGPSVRELFLALNPQTGDAMLRFIPSTPTLPILTAWLRLRLRHWSLG